MSRPQEDEEAKRAAQKAAEEAKKAAEAAKVRLLWKYLELFCRAVKKFVEPIFWLGGYIGYKLFKGIIIASLFLVLLL